MRVKNTTRKTQRQATLYLPRIKNKLFITSQYLKISAITLEPLTVQSWQDLTRTKRTRHNVSSDSGSNRTVPAGTPHTPRWNSLTRTGCRYPQVQSRHSTATISPGLCCWTTQVRRYTGHVTVSGQVVPAWIITVQTRPIDAHSGLDLGLFWGHLNAWTLEHSL